MLRDGSRLLVLSAPLVALVTAAAVTRLAELLPDAAARVIVCGAVVLLPLLLMSDAAWGLRGQLQPVDLPADYAAARQAIRDGPPGDVLVLPLSSYRQPAWNHGLKVLDPAGRSQSRDFVASDGLASSPPRSSPARTRGCGRPGRRWAPPLPGSGPMSLAKLGFGAVLVDKTALGDAPAVDGVRAFDGPWLGVVSIDGARPRSAPTSWVVAMSLAWSAFALLVLLSIGLSVRRRLVRTGGN